MPAIPQRALSGRARQIVIRANTSSRNVITGLQATDNHTLLKYGEVVRNSESDKTTKSCTSFDLDSTDPEETAASDDIEVQEKRTTFGLLEPPPIEHKPAGRWSDPFTLAWRGSGEAEGGGTRWKSAPSWVESQNGRLDPTLIEEEVKDYI